MCASATTRTTIRVAVRTVRRLAAVGWDIAPGRVSWPAFRVVLDATQGADGMYIGGGAVVIILIVLLLVLILR